jgi:hypothetical protein
MWRRNDNVTPVHWQTCTVPRSNKSAYQGERPAVAAVLGLQPVAEGFIMPDQKTGQKKADERAPKPTLSADPDRAIELKVKKHPEDEDAKVDLGSDESMDASDPSSAAQPGNSSEPAPSSGFPEDRARK